MIDRYTRDAIDASHRSMIAQWKVELQDPNISTSTRELLIHMIQHMEENFKYTYSAAKFPNHQIIVRHLRTEPRPLVWEEERMFFLHRWWRKLTIWLDWYLNK